MNKVICKYFYSGHTVQCVRKKSSPDFWIDTGCIKKTYPQTLNAYFTLNIGQILQIFISNESAGQDLSGYVFSFLIKYLFKKISGKQTLS